jgi:hypothetical protein
MRVNIPHVYVEITLGRAEITLVRVEIRLRVFRMTELFFFLAFYN